MGLLKIEVSMVDSGVKKALAESGFCSIGLLLWVRACVLAICPLWVLVVEWLFRVVFEGLLSFDACYETLFYTSILFNDVLMWVVLGF